jgi:hypothetical protein
MFQFFYVELSNIFMEIIHNDKERFGVLDA